MLTAVAGGGGGVGGVFTNHLKVAVFFFLNFDYKSPNWFKIL